MHVLRPVLAFALLALLVASGCGESSGKSNTVKPDVSRRQEEKKDG